MPLRPLHHAWKRPAYALFCIGWGANVCAPMLLLYRQQMGLDDATASAIFGVYAIALVPALLMGGALSDRHGRRPVMRVAVLCSAVASLVLIAGAGHEPLLYLGRVAAGLASGLAFGAGTAWVQELSAGAPDGAGARRAAVAMSVGFGTGGLVGGVIAQWAPHPDLAPYLLHLGMIAVAIPLVWTAPESPVHRMRSRHTTVDGEEEAHGMLLPLRDPRFRRLILPTAPWVFGIATIAFTVLPRLVSSHTHGYAIAFAGVMTGVTQLTGVAIQPWAQRRERAGHRDLMLVALGAGVLGLGIATIVPSLPRAWIVLATAPIFGVAYGVLLVSGLIEVARMAPPRVLGSFVAIFYVLCYAGFVVPYGLALLAPSIGYAGGFALCILAILGAMALVAGELRREARTGAGAEAIRG
ncbi:MAG: MFS transporter [Thermomicrobiales bacterium]